MRLKLHLAVLLAVLSVATAPASAQPANNSDAAARLIFEDAAEAFANGDYERALRGFEQAHDLSNRPGLLYNIGTTLDRLRRDREALEVFERYLSEMPEADNRAEIEARVAQLRTSIAAEAAASQAAEDERARIEAERHAAEQARLQAEEEARRSAAQAEAEAARGTPPILFFSVAGVAVATGAMGLGFGLRTRNLNNQYQLLADGFLVDGVDPTEEQVGLVRSAYNKARSRQTLTNVFLGISGAALIGAVTLIFFTNWGDADEGDEEQAADSAAGRFRPQFAAHMNGFDLGMTYDF